jgi:hypothetical protein
MVFSDVAAMRWTQASHRPGLPKTTRREVFFGKNLQLKKRVQGSLHSRPASDPATPPASK